MLSLLPIKGLPLIRPGNSIADLIVSGAASTGIQDSDVVVIAQKIVSKAEGRQVALDSVEVSPRAAALARETEKDPRLVELILRETREVIRYRPGVLIVEDRRGFICANAGIDRSNVEQTDDGESVLLLPVDPDASARLIRDRIRELTGQDVGVVINDSHGRAWREGTVGVAIGLAGIPAILDRRGDLDLTGYQLQHTVIGIADEIAAAASLLMGPAAEGVPAVIVRGLQLPASENAARDIQRPREFDLFR
ncbi:MAG TPA: coenzyme F420-0:L-glutamate ligase [Chloroflexota bacterium]|nr:coenzyme F420-0:L-glutamate ligase [Chloroflexota bacterium]